MKKTFCIYILFFLVLITAGRVSAQTTLDNFQDPNYAASSSGGVSGKVIHKGQPISNALVVLSSGDSTLTNASGEYMINGVEPGDYTITISKEGYNTANGSIQVVDGEYKSILIKLSLSSETPHNKQIHNPDFEAKKAAKNQNKQRKRQEKKQPQYTTMTVKAYPTKDISGGYKNYGKIWWVYSIKVEEKAGNSRWSDMWQRPSRGSESIKELTCRDAEIGREYRIEIEWRGIHSSDSKVRYWTEKLERRDQEFKYDSPAGY